MYTGGEIAAIIIAVITAAMILSVTSVIIFAKLKNDKHIQSLKSAGLR